MAKFEEKFLVINLKHFEKVPTLPRIWFKALLDEIMKYIPNNKYYVCNQVEPYAQEVIDTILEGEDEKEKTIN